MDKASSSLDSTIKLREAISKLEAYSLQQFESFNGSSVSKTISLMRSIFAVPFDPHPRHHRHQRFPPNKNEVMIAVELINRNRFFIEKLKEGTPAEQELAEKFTETINIYNENCDKRIQGYISSRERLARFFSRSKSDENQKLPKIALSNKVVIQRHYPEHLSPEKIHPLTVNNRVLIPISKQSAELFHMKAIALLERYGIASNPEARAIVKQSPILTALDENSSICTLTQTLILFPGQTIVVRGRSALDPKTRSLNQLLPETFCLSLESSQTGFPHPLQRAGWTLASQLLPDFPQRIDLLEETAELFHKKNQIVLGLLPQGSLLKQAKAILALKKKCFEKHSQEFLDLHKKFITTLLKTASANSEIYVVDDVIEKFFEFLYNSPHAYEYLSDTHHLMNEYFIVKPHQVLLDSIIKGKATNLGNSNAEMRFSEAKSLLDQSLELAKNEVNSLKREAKMPQECIKFDYIEFVGSILGQASKHIFLQYLSEDLIFSPPVLTSFECKVQIAAYLHLRDFIDEFSFSFEKDKKQDLDLIYQTLKNALISDIALFQSEEKSSFAISKELSSYFQKRYLSLSAI